MQQIIGSMQDDYKRLACAFDKSVVANFPRTRLKLRIIHVIHRLQIGMTNPSHFTGC
jgi:hypothetical protein